MIAGNAFTLEFAGEDEAREFVIAAEELVADLGTAWSAPLP